MAKNIFGKTRDINKPYAEYLVGDIVYRILKTYKMAKNENNKFDRWFTVGKSPMTFGEWEYGDMYKNDILKFGILVKCDDEWRKIYHEKN